jgi:hypothetical protein
VVSEQTAVRAGTAAQGIPKTAWAGYAACAWGLIFAAISFYWGSGGRRGIDTVGGSIEKRALAGDPAIYAAVWTTGLLKVVGAVLALALVMRWGRRAPRRLVAVLGWFAALVSTAYGAVLVASGALVAGGVIKPSTPVDRKPLLWHLYLWDMSFLIWGLLFLLALWRFPRSNRPDRPGAGSGETDR